MKSRLICGALSFNWSKYNGDTKQTVQENKHGLKLVENEVFNPISLNLYLGFLYNQY